ncbi:MAG: D-alanine--D-alanine ligase family protein [Spirochaetia bacterium]|nr:D-alanine--D-alanine ligase family protein [Spirochaetia bacterium]
MNKTENVMIVFGGNSPEHEVSLRSAATIYRHIDRNLFNPIPVGMTRDGRFYRIAAPADGADFVISPETCLGDPLSFTPGKPVCVGNDEINFVFPIAHGAYGEDGRLQGFLEMLGLPYAGCRTVGSAVCMDKELTKRLCAAAGIPVVPFTVLRSAEEAAAEAAVSLGYPLVVKPVNAGSSRGVTKVKCESELKAAVDEAFAFDTKVLLEQCVTARELECAVIGNGPFTVFPPGEVVSTHEFYDYDSKYRDSLSADLRLRADLPEETSALIQKYAGKAAEQCEVDGFARIDFFLDKNSGAVYLNEINTLPGFTSGSLFPLMCAENGIPITEIITKIIRMGQEESAKRFKFEPVTE